MPPVPENSSVPDREGIDVDHYRTRYLDGLHAAFMAAEYIYKRTQGDPIWLERFKQVSDLILDYCRGAKKTGTQAAENKPHG